MKKLLTVLLACLMLITLVACAQEEEPVVVEKTTGTYTVYNRTGAKLTELYLYEVGAADKGTNYAADGIKNNKKVVLTYEGYAEGDDKTVLCLEFNYEEGTTQKFETLHIETAPITLQSVDAAAGATAIKFEVPTGKGVYNITNDTGADVVGLYMYAAGSDDKGVNHAETPLAQGASYTLEFEGEYAQDYVLEFVNAEGEARNFPTLHIEEANITLLSVDAAAGATNIAFGY